jgi:hypothetical protein
MPVGGTARTAIVRYMGQRGAGRPDEPLFLGRRGALDWRGMQQVLKRLQGPGRHHRAMQPALPPPHVRPELPRQRRRRVQPPADPWPHDPRHGQALRRAGGGGNSSSAPRRCVSSRPIAHWTEGVGHPAAGSLPPALPDRRPNSADDRATCCCCRRAFGNVTAGSTCGRRGGVMTRCHTAIFHSVRPSPACTFGLQEHRWLQSSSTVRSGAT